MEFVPKISCFQDEYLSRIPAKQMKCETEALKIVKMLDKFASRLSFLLKISLKGREEKNEEVAKSVFQSVELIITSVQRISLGMLTNNILRIMSIVIEF